jgi:hypothetical protein
LTVPNNSAFTLGTNNFTIEFWVNFNSVAAGQRIAGQDNNVGGYTWAFYTNATGTLSYYLSSTGTTWNLAGPVSIGSVAIGQWYHIALVRNGSVFTPYINGVSGTTTTTASALFTPTNVLTLGAAGGTALFNGYISNFRMVNGVSVYTNNFTVPSSPLAAVQSASGAYIQAITGTQTSLLTCNGPTIIDGSTNAFTITNNGSAPVSTAIVPTFTNVTITGYTAPYTANYLIVAGGGAGAPSGGGGGGGGMLVGSTLLTAGQTYSITVGAGGTGGLMSTTAPTNGSNSLFNSITSIGGGKGGDDFGSLDGGVGGSGGGAGRSTSQRVGGNSVYGQGNPGGINTTASVYPAGGGGGAGGVGGNGSGGSTSGNGGAGGLSYITGSAVYYAGGGGGGLISGTTPGTGGTGGGGNGTVTATGGAGTVNTGGGGGGSYQLSGSTGGSGGSGVVILSVPTINYTGTTTGSPTVTTSGTYKILTFTASGSYTA